MVVPEITESLFLPSSEPFRVEKTNVCYVAMDCSKIGSSSDLPSVPCIVDACQMRLSVGRLNAILDAGHTVVATLSKFFCGPAFCGLVLTKRRALPPSSVARDLSRGLFLRFCVAEALARDYFAVPLEKRLQLSSMFVQVVKVPFLFVFVLLVLFCFLFMVFRASLLVVLCVFGFVFQREKEMGGRMLTTRSFQSVPLYRFLFCKKEVLPCRLLPCRSCMPNSRWS